MPTYSRNDELAAMMDAPTLGAAVRMFKLAYLRRALLRAGGNRRDAAAEAGIGYSTFKATLRHAAEFAMRDHVSPKREYRRSLRSFDGAKPYCFRAGFIASSHATPGVSRADRANSRRESRR